MSPDQNIPSTPEAAQDDYRVAPEPPPARERTSRWPGWIWSIPIAAVAVVVWLAVKYIAVIGPAITVTFDSASGISAGNTEVHYNGLKVGTVESVHLTSDLKQVEVHIRMNSDMVGHLGAGTQFWISSGPSLNNLASLRSIIAGQTIEISPHNGKTQHHFVGLEQPPALPKQMPGRNFVLTAGQKGNLRPGADVYYKGEDVGTVIWIKLQADSSFKFGVFVKAPYAALVHDGTRFWDASAVQFSMHGPGPRIQVLSPAALLQGAIAFETPSGAAEGALASDNHQFTLYSGKDAAMYAPGPSAVAYNVTFDASGGGLSNDATVELAGKRVGVVEGSRLMFDPKAGAIEEEATLELEPSRMPLTAGASWDHPRQQMDALLNKLIARGLRAELGSSVPLVGAANIRLSFVAAPSNVGLLPGSPPSIPSQPGGNGIQGIMTSVNDITAKLNSLPLAQIGQNIDTITGRAADLAASKQLQQTLNRLDASVANIQHVTAAADRQVPQLIAQLRAAAVQTDAAIRSARSLLSNESGVTPTGLQTAGLSQTLYQLSETARAIRELADYLDRHPSALLRGRG